MALLTASADIRRVLETISTVAVLGAHHDPWRAAFYVPDYLHRHGYRVVAVNPTRAGETAWGGPVRPSLAEATEAIGPIDLVVVFRRSEDLPAHVDDIVAMEPLPRVVWFQTGIRHRDVTRALVERGIEVVEDRCMYQDHRLFGLARRHS